MDEWEKESLKAELEEYLTYRVVFEAVQQRIEELAREESVKEYLRISKNFGKIEEDTSFAFRDVVSRVKTPTLVTDKHGKTFLVTPTDVIEVRERV